MYTNIYIYSLAQRVLARVVERLCAVRLAVVSLPTASSSIPDARKHAAHPDT